MRKKILSLILVAVFVLSICCVFSACGKKADTSPSTAPTTATKAAATTVAQGGDDNSAADNDAADDNDQDTDNNDDGGSANASSNTSLGGAGGNTSATTGTYNGDTVITDDRAAEYVMDEYSYGDSYTTQSGGDIVIPDGSVWHNVIVYDENGEMTASYYVSDTTGDVKSVEEMEAYAYR